jgi:hypothetical protein
MNYFNTNSSINERESEEDTEMLIKVMKPIDPTYALPVEVMERLGLRAGRLPVLN